MAEKTVTYDVTDLGIKSSDPRFRKVARAIFRRRGLDPSKAVYWDEGDQACASITISARRAAKLRDKH